MSTRSVIAIIVLIALAVGAYLLFGNRAAVPQSGDDGVENMDDTTARYANSVYDISFEYPRNYVLREKEVGNAERGHYSIVLIDQQALAELPHNGEGPPAITIDLFQNNLDQRSAEEWTRWSSFSNLKLSPDGIIASTTVAGTPALSYTWDGLYRGESIVFAHKDNIIMMSVQYLDREDQIVTDYQIIVSSFELN